MTQQVNKRKVRVGRVVSNRMDKTVVIAVERRAKHPLYGKSVRHLTKFKAHDEENQFQVGDVVRIVESRPLSLTKRWRVVELLGRKEVPEIAPVEATDPEPEVKASIPTRRRRSHASQATAVPAATVVAESAEESAEEPAVEEPEAEPAEEVAEEPATEEEPEAEPAEEVAEEPATEEEPEAEPVEEVADEPAVEEEDQK